MPVPGLIALALRRTLPLVFAATLVLLLVLAARDDGTLSAGAGTPLALRGLRRLDVWSVLFVVGLPMLVVLGARLGARGRADWLAPTPASRARLSLSLGLGVAAAALALSAVTALAAEVALGPCGPGWRQAGTRPSPAALLTEADARVRWRDADLAALVYGSEARLRLGLTVAPGSGPAVDATFSARAGEGAASTVHARLSGRTTLELALAPEARGPVELELARSGPGAVLVLPQDALELVVSAASERLASLELGLRALELLGAAALLAFGLAAWMRPSLAAGTVLALVLLLALRPRAQLLPGADLSAAWRQVASGLVPAHGSLVIALSSLACAALGVALHALALGVTRRSS